MISAADAFLVLGILAGIVLIAIGYRTYQMSERLGRRSFVALMLILGIGCVAAGLGWVIPSPVLPNEGGPIEWARVLFVIWSLSVVPWFVFATRYTGTQTQNQLQTLALAGIPVLVLVADALLFLLDFESDVLSILSAFVFLYTLFLAATGTYLIVKKSYKYGHIRLGQGVSLSVVPLAPVVFWNLIGTASSGPLGPAGAYAGGVLFAALGASIALTRYETFESTPSIGTLGERALIRETGDLMIVVDDSDRVVTINETATEMLGVTREATVGTSLQQCLGHDSAGLRDAETVTVQTTRGSRKYDPQVSLVRDHCNNGIGATLSLRDVTERGLRELAAVDPDPFADVVQVRGGVEADRKPRLLEDGVEHPGGRPLPVRPGDLNAGHLLVWVPEVRKQVRCRVRPRPRSEAPQVEEVVGRLVKLHARDAWTARL